MNKETNIREEEIILAPPAELFDEAKRISQDTTHDEKYPFALQYDTNQKEFLLSMLKMAGATVEDDDENNHLLSTMMNMTQLAFIKSLDCVERVKTDEGINPFLVENTTTLMPAHQTQRNSNVLETEIIEVHSDLVARRTIATNLETEEIAEEVQENNGIAVASVDASSRSSAINCPTNMDMANAQEIAVGTVVSGNICCPGAEQWFRFTVPTSKKYTIFTAGSLDTIGTLSSSYLPEPITNDDYAGRINFRIVNPIHAGYDYYIRVRAKNDATGRYTLMVTEDILAEEVVIYPNRNDNIVVLEQGKTYELPRGDGYTFLNAPNTENAPLSVKVTPSTTTDKRVYWGASSTPSDPVDINLTWYQNNTAYQEITANTCGGTKLYAYDWFERGKRDEVIVAVIPNGGSLVKATGISLDHASLRLNIGDYETIAATVSPGNATVQDVEWVSDNTDIATVNPYGLVKAIAPGTTRIRAKSMTGTPVVEAVCTVTVLDPLAGGPPIIVKCSGGLSVMSAAIDGTLLGTFANGSTIYLVDETPQNETMFNVFGTMSDGTSTYGWCSGEYLEIETTFLKHNVKEQPSNVRNNFSLNNDNIVGEISYGMQVELVQEKAENNDGYDWHKIIYNDEIAYIAHFNGRYEKVVRLTPLRCNKSAIVADRYLSAEEKQHNAKIIYNYLAYKGWSKNAICGAIANMEAESTLSPGRLEMEDHDNDGDKAYGLLQWDPPTKWTNYAQSHNYEQNNIYRQIDYLIYSTRYGGGEWLISGVPTTYKLHAYDYAYSTHSAYDLAITFLLCYERPTDAGTLVRNYRGSLAEDWRKYFNNIGW